MTALGLDVILLGLGLGSEFVLQHLHIYIMLWRIIGQAIMRYSSRLLSQPQGITAQDVAHNGVCI